MGMAHRQGMTLIEMMVALVIFSIVLASALGALRSQTRGFDRGAEEMSLRNVVAAEHAVRRGFDGAGSPRRRQ